MSPKQNLWQRLYEISPGKQARARSWILVPLRLFLGLTFLYAGLQKIVDPQFFQATARGYIGRQIAAFAFGSPLHNFLLTVAAPHALLFGALIILGELAVGLCTLLGLLLRPAALIGLLLNLLFFLSADWRVFPYFYGSDIVFLFCWLTLFLAGPANQILPALDTRLVEHLYEQASQQRQPVVAALCAWMLGIRVRTSTAAASQFRIPSMGTQPSLSGPLATPRTGLLSTYASSQGPITQTGGWPSGNGQVGPQSQAGNTRPLPQSRRHFLWGTMTGGGVTLALVWLIALLRQGQSSVPPTAQAQSTPPPASPPASASSTPGSATVAGEITTINTVPVNSAFPFNLPANKTFAGDPGILIHLENGEFVAYDAVCTHAGCPVDYDPESHNLICPCHGATFDPARTAAVVNGPAQLPLTGVPIKVDKQTGTISLNL